jgi:hypothetical protein
MTRKEQLEHALDYAAQTGSFHKRNLEDPALSEITCSGI